MTRISIDWLQFTFTDINNNNVDSEVSNIIISVLRLDAINFIELNKGKLGYKKQLYYNNISVLYDGSKDMGIHVIISGQGCRFYESDNDLIELIERINDRNGKLTRIDLAMDDMKGDVILFNELISDIKNANIVSKWKDSTEIIKRSNTDGHIIGHTMNVGSGSSRIYMRIYNKALEQNKNCVWNRIELEIKKEYAENIQKIINSDNVGKLMCKILNNYIRIVEKCETDKNKSRWKTKQYWQNIINTTEKLKLTKVKEEKTIDTTKEWLNKQVAPSLALVSLSDENLDFIMKQIVQGQSRLKERHIKMLNKNKRSVIHE